MLNRLAARNWLPLFVLLAIAYCAWVFTLPLFPSQDGPNHLFDAAIFARLLAHTSPMYAQYYAVRYLFAPYSFHYYLLIVLMKFVSPLMADKLVVCLIILSFAFGFRYLATGIGPSGGLLSLFAFAIVLNWPLAMGFENYCLALTMDIGCLGLWVRFLGQRDYPKRLLFIALAFLTALTHPVALPVLVLFCALDLALRCIASRRQPRAEHPSYARDLLTLLISASVIAYIAHFIDNHAAAPHPLPYSPTWNLRTYLAMYGLAFIGKHGIGSLIYRAVLLAVLVTGLFIAARAFRRKNWAAPESFLTITLLALLLLPFVPESVNDPYYLAVRLLPIVWIGALASASAHKVFTARAQSALAVGAASAAIIVLAIAVQRINPLAARIAIIRSAPLQPAGSVGLALPAYEGVDYTYPVVYSLPFEWASSHYFRESSAVMLNAPWMDSTYFPMGPTPALLTGQVNFAVLQQPVEFRKLLLEDKQLQQLVFPRIRFIFFTDPAHIATDATLNAVLQLDPTAHWSCRRNDWYILCDK